MLVCFGKGIMTIAFANHKGGTGKTTSVISIGKSLLNMGYKVLLIDLDPQGNLTYSLGLQARKYSVAEFMTGESGFSDTVCESSGLHVLPADNKLYLKANDILKLPYGFLALKTRLENVSAGYDFILIDCAPSLSVYTTNAFNAAEGVIIPMVFETLSIQGLEQILAEIATFQESTNPGLFIIGALGVIVNENRKLSEEVLQYVRDNYSINVFNNHVRNNVKAAEAPSFGLSVIDYAPACISSRDYVNVTKELLSILELEIKNIN